ncbi:MAG TPA: type II toxin-antitoxin system Phd/YefM family antitoxin [Alphaproteobacteria bacterium]
MPQINIHQAKSTLSKLVAAAEDMGEETTLCRAGKPVAKITPIGAKTVCKARKPGCFEGKIEISDDFDDFLPAESAIFSIPGAK